jgi:diguanylate cyclase (GGDEF)-like protein
VTAPPATPTPRTSPETAPRTPPEAAPVPATRAADLVVVVDDDVELARFVERNLRCHGLDVILVPEASRAADAVSHTKPDLVLVSAALSDGDGLELTRQLRADPMTAALPVIVLTAADLSSVRLAALAAGADDCVAKPFDAGELVARVLATLRRNREYREVSPLTGLPGNTRILREIANRVRGGEEYAVCVFDIDRFKSVNDAYGFERGDKFITMLANCLQRSIGKAGGPKAFLGHIGGDDFVLVCAPGQVRAITQQAVEEFEQGSEALYDPVDAERGYLELVDRRGNIQRPNLVTISVGVALSTRRKYTDPREVVAVANEMKQVAKRQPGSFVAYDRRRSP